MAEFPASVDKAAKEDSVEESPVLVDKVVKEASVAESQA